MDRRRFLLSAAAAGAARAASGKKFRAALIAHTGRGNYGHGLDVVWKAFDDVEIVAVADPVESGREQALERTGAPRGYADYREMLDREKPDFVSVCPRHLDQRADMVVAAAEAGAHIYCEKPFAKDLQDADRMVAAIERAGVKLQLAHQMRRSPYTLRVMEMIAAGEIGEIQEVRGRGKEDHRAGGEDLMVLGPHICDVMRMALGDPEWVFAQMGVDGRALRPGDRREATEPLGMVASNQIAAMFGFANGVHGYFASKACDATHIKRFGTHFYGSKGVIFLPNAIYPVDAQPWILRTPAWSMGEGAEWEPVEVAQPERNAPETHQLANVLMVEDLFAAVAEDREPACGPTAGRWTVEMMMGIYRSEIAGGPVPFPAEEREHPLESWG